MRGRFLSRPMSQHPLDLSYSLGRRALDNSAVEISIEAYARV